jgi:predicted esterase
MPLDQTTTAAYEITDFEAVHRLVDGGDGAASIFGGLPISTPTDLAPELSAFLGRWEGFGYGPPIKRDWKYVLTVTDIGPRSGTAYLWAGTNLQFPSQVEAITFRVRGSGPETAIEWEQTVNGAYAVVGIEHATGTDALEGDTSSADPEAMMGPVLLRKDTSNHVVYRDYTAFLATHGIEWRAHADQTLERFGAGSLVYLPPGYHEDPSRMWPLILFLHGSGDRGDNGLVIAQNSPFSFVTAGNPLDAIVVAPLLASSAPTFPIEHLDAVLDDAMSTYRVDRERVTLTGLSMGGEATYRFARHRPDDVAGIAVLCGFDPAHFPRSLGWGYAPIADPAERLRDVPVLAIHGRDDTIVPLEAGQGTVDALLDAGVAVTLTVLDHHDHDVWTATYSDPEFFTWLLDRTRRPQ